MTELNTITPNELKEKLENNEQLHLIDVRENEEVAGGMIPQAKHIPMGEIPMSLEQLDKNNEYIVICRSGGRSENVCYFLHDHGFQVRNLVGGMLKWQGETKPKE